VKFERQAILLKAEDVSLKFGTRLILRDINFAICDIVRPDVKQGQVISLIGRSGIGKTQMFKIMSGLIQPTTGIVKIGVDQHEVKAGDVGIIPQNYILFEHRSVQKNLMMGLNHSATKYSDKDKQDIIKQYATSFDLTEHLNKYPSQLSGGQKQRVSIIQQVLAGNHFIFLDEPFSGLDMLMIDKVVDLLTRLSLSHEHNTLIMVSHDVENSLAISDTAFILAKQANQEGATITETLDLIGLGFAWHSDIKKSAEFQEMVASIKFKI
jgi:ABC-type nitrate/sulfonate/bicarbonate transport system ATPase subunit